MDSKKKCAVFADFSAWYYRAQTFRTAPAIKTNINYLKKHYILEKMIFFTNVISKETNQWLLSTTYAKINDIGGDIIDIKDADAHENLFLFAIIEEICIYVTQIPPEDRQNHCIVIMSGDWRFARIIDHIQTEMGIEVLVYAAEGTIDEELHKTAATIRTFKIIKNEEKVLEVQETLLRNEIRRSMQYAHKNDKMASIRSLSNIVSNITKLPEVVIKQVIQKLIDDGVIIKYNAELSGQPRILIRLAEFDQPESNEE